MRVARTQNLSLSIYVDSCLFYLLFTSHDQSSRYGIFPYLYTQQKLESENFPIYRAARTLFLLMQHIKIPTRNTHTHTHKHLHTKTSDGNFPFVTLILTIKKQFSYFPIFSRSHSTVHLFNSVGIHLQLHSQQCSVDVVRIAPSLNHIRYSNAFGAIEASISLYTIPKMTKANPDAIFFICELAIVCGFFMFSFLSLF